MAQKVDLVGDLAIKQGLSYFCTILWTGDVSSATPRAIARWDYKYTGAVAVFEFSFLPLAYPVLNEAIVDDNGDPIPCTQITLYLTDQQTEAIEITKYQGGDLPTKPGKVYCFDLELEFPDGRVNGLDVGFIQVKPEVT